MFQQSYILPLMSELQCWLFMNISYLRIRSNVQANMHGGVVRFGLRNRDVAVGGIVMSDVYHVTVRFTLRYRNLNKWLNDVNLY